MADKKISELTALTGSDTATDDQLVIVDTSAGLTKSITVAEFQNALDGSTGFVRITGDTMTGNLNMGDNVKAVFGAGSDLQIYHDGTRSYVDDTGAGSLWLRGGDVAIKSTASETMADFANNGAVQLYYDNAAKIATTSTGVAITGGATFSGSSNFGDGNELRFGADNDLAIFHSSGVNNIRSDAGTLKIRSDDMRFTAQNGTSEFARFDSSGNFGIGTSSPTAVLDVRRGDADGKIAELHNNVGYGIDIGSSTADAYISSGYQQNFLFKTDAGSGQAERMRIDSSGDVMVGGTVAGNAGTISLNVGDAGSTNGGLQLWGSTTGTHYIQFGDESGTAANHYRGYMAYAHNGDSLRFGTASTEAMRIDSSGRVGIGTSPSYTFDVSAANAVGMIRTPDTTPPTLGLFVNSGSNGVGTISVDNGGHMTFDTGSSGAGQAERMRIDSSGNVGIGTSSPNVYTGYTSLTLNHATNGGIIDIERNGTLVGEMFTTDANTFSLAAVGAKAMNFSTNSAERMRIDSSGRVGIGTNSPSAKLDVAGTVNAYGNGSVSLQWGDTTALGSLSFDGSANPVIRSASSKSLVFQTNGANEAMRIDSSGNVGIGVTSPTGILSISGADTTSRPQLRFMSSVGTGLADAALSTTDDSGGTSLLIGSNLYYSGGSITRFSTSRSGAAIGFGYTGSMKFYTGSGNTAPDQKMALDASGNLLVGKTSSDLGATAGIELNGQYDVGYFTRSGDKPLVINRLTSDGTIIDLRKDGVTVGSIGTSGGNLIVQGSPLTGKTGIKFGGAEWVPQDTGADSDGGVDLGLNTARFKDIYATNGTIQTSDRNEKQDIAELTDAEQRVAVAAKGLLRKFRWRDSVEAKGDEARTHFGIIAQDLQAAFAAEGLDAGDYAMFISGTWTDEETGEERTRMGVRYSELLAFIIAAI